MKVSNRPVFLGVLFLFVIFSVGCLSFLPDTGTSGTPASNYNLTTYATPGQAQELLLAIEFPHPLFQKTLDFELYNLSLNLGGKPCSFTPLEGADNQAGYQTLNVTPVLGRDGKERIIYKMSKSFGEEKDPATGKYVVPPHRLFLRGRIGSECAGANNSGAAVRIALPVISDENDIFQVLNPPRAALNSTVRGMSGEEYRRVCQDNGLVGCG
ncbi:Uncharacterised protein [uncultured archaeon]|nr:Uncharacterised protein [uncultured archaeon]